MLMAVPIVDEKQFFFIGSRHTYLRPLPRENLRREERPGPDL